MPSCRRIVDHDICLISINDTVSDGATRTLVLNIGRSHNRIMYAKEFEPNVQQCIEYFFCDAGLHVKTHFSTKNV